MNVAALKDMTQNVQFLSTGSQDYETGDKCLVAGPAQAVRNDLKFTGPAPQ